MENEIFYSPPLEINLSAGFSRMQQNTRHGTSNNPIITEITADLFWERFGYDSLETAQVSLGNYVVIDRESKRPTFGQRCD